jgi:hypothetical protein
MSRIIIWLVVIIVIALGVWYFWSGSNNAPVSQTSTAPSSATTGTQTTPASGGTSNAALNQQSASIDAQLQGASSDSASVDQSLNDKPVTQTE